MGKTNVFWKIVSQNYTPISTAENPNSKMVKYSCNYCFHRYAYNVTRMAGHLLTDCTKCPQEVKDKICEFHKNPHLLHSGTLNSQSISKTHDERSILTRKVNARWAHVSKHYTQLPSKESKQEKYQKYQCIYCSQSYACNITRMAKHILECEKCSPEIKDSFYDISTPITTTPTADTFAFESCGSELNASDDNNSLSIRTNLFEIDERFNENVHKIEIDSENSDTDNIEEKSSFEISNTSIEKNETWGLLARACYATGTSVNILKNEHWQKVLNKICPEFELPPPQLLSHDYLSNEYNCIQEIVKEKIKEAKTLGLQIHGLHNKYEAAIIILLTTPEPVVYKVADAKTIRSNPNNLTELISEIINKNGINRILSIVTDNVQISWKAVETEIPNSLLSCYTCNIHILKLLISDIFNLHSFREVISECSKIVLRLKKLPIISQTNFIENKDEKRVLVISKKYFEKTKDCLNYLISNKHVLPFVDEIVFWPNVLLLYELLKYLVDWVAQMKSKSTCISSVVQCYFDLNNKFKESFKNINISTEQSTEILNCLAKYEKFAVQDIHKAASLLNPYFKGSNLTDEDIIDAIAFINKLAKGLPDVKPDKIMFDIAGYRTNQGIWAKDFVWDALKMADNNLLPPIIWWQSMCASTEICKIAVVVLSCSPVLVNIGKLSDMDSRKRCKSTKTQKLIYIKHNLKLLENKEILYNNKNEMETDCYLTDTDSDSSINSENE